MEGKTATSWLDLGPGFVRRVMITTIWFGAVSFLLLGFYIGLFPAAAWIVGVALGIADLALIDLLIREAIGERRRRVIAVYFVLKTVVLYAAGAAALLWLNLNPFFLLAGFTLFLAVALLKVLGRLALSTSWMLKSRKGPGGPLLRNSPSRRSSST